MSYTKESTATLIKWFEKRIYPVYIRQKETYSESTIRLRGIPSVGDKKQDAALLNEKVLVYWSIPTIIQKREEGVEIFFRDSKYAKEIYDLSSALIAKIVDDIHFSGRIGPYNHEVVVKIDSFLADMFSIAAPSIPIQNSAQSLLASLSLSTQAPAAQEKQARSHKPIVEQIDELLQSTRMRELGVTPQKGDSNESPYKPFNFY